MQPSRTIERDWLLFLSQAPTQSQDFRFLTGFLAYGGRIYRFRLYRSRGQTKKKTAPDLVAAGGGFRSMRGG